MAISHEVSRVKGTYGALGIEGLFEDEEHGLQHGDLEFLVEHRRAKDAAEQPVILA